MFEEGILRLDEVPLNGEVQELPLGFSKYGQELTVVSQKPWATKSEQEKENTLCVSFIPTYDSERQLNQIQNACETGSFSELLFVKKLANFHQVQRQAANSDMPASHDSVAPAIECM